MAVCTYAALLMKRRHASTQHTQQFTQHMVYLIQGFASYTCEKV